jgi:hypothetical protein
MNISNIPRTYLLGLIMGMIAILVAITAINPGSLGFKDKTDYDAQRKLAEQQTKEYEALLADVAPDYEASQQLLKKIASEDIVRQEVESTLNVNQRVVVPAVLDSEINLAQRNDRAEVMDYANRLGSMIANYNEKAQGGVNQSFGENTDAATVASSAQATKALTENIRGLAVPKDAVEMHKAYLTAYRTYGSFLDTATQFAKGTNSEPWSTVYGQYSVINNRLTTATNEGNRLTQKYALNVPMPEDLALQQGTANIFGIKSANAQVGIITVIDIKQAAELGIRAGLARAFAKFSVSMIDKLVAHIEKNFAIASQLYYSQDLGRYYSVEYMKKFVSDPLDQDIIQKFLPQYFCVSPNKGELKKIFTAKAAANQGTDIVIDPNDPEYLTKLARLGGDERNYSGWWEEYYTSLAATTQQQADAAATKEVLSPGLKSGRDLVNGQINKTMSSIFNVQESAISGAINLGNNNAENLVGELVAGLVENMINKFVFTPIGGGTSGSGGIGVVGESNVCLKVPQMKPIAPIPAGQASLSTAK